MIQRIQTIFLLLAAGALGSLFAFPFAVTTEPEAQGIFQDAQYNVNDNIGLLVLAVIGVLLAVVAMFSYKNRIMQMRLGYLGLTVSILIPVVAFLYFTSQVGSMDAEAAAQDALGLYAPLAAILLFFLANRFVKKDEKLVQSMDRLR